MEYVKLANVIFAVLSHSTFYYPSLYEPFISSFDGPGSSNMALIDVTMVSGFEPILHELDMKLQSNSAEFLYYEFDEGKLTFYFEKVSGKQMGWVMVILSLFNFKPFIFGHDLHL